MQNEEIDSIVEDFLSLKKQYKSKSNYLNLQNKTIEKLYFLVSSNLYKYKNFSNYKDLEQDGIIAMLKAMKTWEREKGPFSYWAREYIKTRISRQANKHSDIKYPMDVAKNSRPIKVSKMPLIIDHNKNPYEFCEINDNNKYLLNILNSTENGDIIKYVYGIGIKQHSLTATANIFGISTKECKKILKSSMAKLKINLQKELT